MDIKTIGANGRLKKQDTDLSGEREVIRPPLYGTTVKGTSGIVSPYDALMRAAPAREPDYSANAYSGISAPLQNSSAQTANSALYALGDNSSTETRGPLVGTDVLNTDVGGTTVEREVKPNSGLFESQEDEINSRYDALTAAEMLRIQSNVNSAKSKYETDLTKALPEYQKKREQQDLLSKQNAQKISEYAFYSGDRGGMSRQDMLQNLNSGQEIIGAINLQEMMLKDDTNRAITDLLAQGNTDMAIAEAKYAAERADALYQERVRLQESNAAWTKWLSSETGYLPNGQKSLSREQFEYQQAQNNKNSSSSGGSSYGGGTGYISTSAQTPYNSYMPTANAYGNHAQYNEEGTWQPYYTNDGMKTTPADYQAPAGTSDVASWIINSANQYTDGADIMSGITDTMRDNLVMSYIGANYNNMTPGQQNAVLNYYGKTPEDLLNYFSV